MKDTRRALGLALVAVMGCGGATEPAGRCPIPLADGTCPGDLCPTGIHRAVPGGPCVELGWMNCPAGFVPDSSGWGCEDVSPATPCPAGTRPALGSTNCVPVGPTACPAGFEPDPSGWGCADVLPVEPCVGPTREALGQRLCVPLGDCDETFPPAEATMFVDAAFTPAQLDAKHLTRLADAVAQAAAGEVIAVESGTYPEAVNPSVPLTLWGRCAARVVMDGAALATMGISVLGVRGVTVRGVTVRGFVTGARVIGGGQLELKQVLVEGSREAGASASESGSELRLTGSAVRGTRGAAVAAWDGALLAVTDSAIAQNQSLGVLASGAGARATIDATVVRDTYTRAGEDRSSGAYAMAGARIELRRSALIQNRQAGAFADGAESSLLISESVVRDSLGGRDMLGCGACALGGRLAIERSSLVRNGCVTLQVEGPGSTLEVRESVVRDARCNPGVPGAALALFGGARATLWDTALVGTTTLTLYASGSKVRLGRSLLIDARTSRAALSTQVEHGAEVELEDSAVVGGGVGMFDSETTARISGSLVLDTNWVGLWVGGARAVVDRSVFARGQERPLHLKGAGSELEMTFSVVRDMLRPAPAWAHSQGLYVEAGATAPGWRAVPSSGTTVTPSWSTARWTFRRASSPRPGWWPTRVLARGCSYSAARAATSEASSCWTTIYSAWRSPRRVPL